MIEYQLNSQKRNYFLFNYDNNLQLMLEHGIIGLNSSVKSLRNVINQKNSLNQLNKKLEEQLENSIEEKKLFPLFIFDIKIGDVVCLSDNKTIKAIGVVESDYQFKQSKELNHVRFVDWIHVEDIKMEDGNHRVKIREVVCKKNHDIIEKYLNDYIANRDDTSLLVNYPSRITIEQYIEYFEVYPVSKIETRILKYISKKPNGANYREIRNAFENYNIEKIIEHFAARICTYHNIVNDEYDYAHNLFNGYLEDGELHVKLKSELETALFKEGNQLSDEEIYDVDQACEDSVFGMQEYHRLLDILYKKRNIYLYGDWGCGKSFLARKLSYLIIEKRLLKNVLHIKIHPALTYQSLLESKLIINFIEQANANRLENFVIIFEDAHENNLNTILGELTYLIADNNRRKENALDVSYLDEKLYLPKNIFTIITSRKIPNPLDNTLLSNTVYYEVETQYNERFRLLFNDVKLGGLISDTYSKINDILRSYNFSINHGLFIKGNNGVTYEEYKIVLKYKIIPLIKSIKISVEDNKKILELIDNVKQNK